MRNLLLLASWYTYTGSGVVLREAWKMASDTQEAKEQQPAPEKIQIFPASTDVIPLFWRGLSLSSHIHACARSHFLWNVVCFRILWYDYVWQRNMNEKLRSIGISFTNGIKTE